ncbi:MAG: autotransporter domain-containing protein [Comamonas sp.]|uniref:autotransporter domain-containing protein n=1 Tax=Comamonas sp. TaxID=34028 RepID=UPI002816A912|nr:autotransporter domain-containing protein [Comamonas sp.]MDR0213063.1 autotransporter domain-containing protein [Comamonas sp.]
MTITVNPLAPVANAASATVAANSSANPISLNLGGGAAASVAIGTPASHGTATANGTRITYTPAVGYSGADSFTYTATNAGGTSAPATVTITVNKPAPTAPAVSVSTLANKPVTIEAAANASNGPFTALAISTPPGTGTAAVQGMNLIYTPAATMAGAVHFAYTLSNSTGVSLPIAVTVQVNPVPIVIAPIQVSAQPAQTLSVDVTTGATGGPFIGASILSVQPANAGTATLISTEAQASPVQGVALKTASAGNGYTISYTPAAAFAGTAVVSYTLSNAFATSAPATLSVAVAPRADPSADADVQGLVNAQIQAARRFASAQLSNYHQRLEQLRSPNRQAFSNQLSVVMPRAAGGTVRDCQSLQNPLEQQACFTTAANASGASQFNGANGVRQTRAGLLDGQAGFVDSRDAQAAGSSGGMSGTALAAVGRNSALPNMGEETASASGAAGRPQWAVWTAGSVDFGFADASSQQSGFRFTTNGVTVGADYLVSDKLVVGAGLGYGHDRTRIGEMGTRSNADSISAAVYGSYSLGRGVYVDGVAGYSSLRFDSRRWVGAANDFAQGRRDGDQWFAALSAGYEYRSRDWLVSPYGRVLMSRANLQRFDETGAGINALTFFNQRVTTTSGVLGLRTEFSQETRWGMLQPFARVEAQHDFEGQSDARLSYADIAGMGPVYQVSGTPYGRDRIQLGLGSKLRTKAGVWSVDFQLMRSSGLLDRRVRLGFTAQY